MRAPALSALRLSRSTSAAEAPPVSSMLADHTAASWPDARRWWALAAIAVAQLMIVVDGTIMNIALPSAREDLGLSSSGSRWVITRAEADGWNSVRTLGSLAAGVVLLALFVVVERRIDGPLLPLRVVLNPQRGAAYLAALSWGIGVIAAFFFLSFYLQTVLGYSSLRTGLAFLPYTAAIMVTVRVVRRFVGTVPVQRLLTPGLLAIAAGLALIGLLPDDGYYGTRVLPIFLLLGIGSGLTLIPATSTATLNTGPDTGVAGAMVMTGQQVGGSLGTAVLGTLAATATADYLRDHAGAAGVAAVHGYNVAGFIGAAMLCVMAVVVFVVAGSRRSTG